MHPVQAKRLNLGFTVTELAAQTGLSVPVLYSIENKNRSRKVHESVASILAKFFGCNVEDIFDRQETTDIGRPAKTGGPTTASSTRTNGICQGCWIELPSSGVCSDCNE